MNFSHVTKRGYKNGFFNTISKNQEGNEGDGDVLRTALYMEWNRIGTLEEAVKI